MGTGQPDPRTSPYRPDLASAALRHTVAAPRYVEPWSMEITADLASVVASPDRDARQESQALFGEPVAVFEEKEGWSWVQIGTDDYVGYVRSSALGPPAGPKSHKICALRTYVYSKADLKSPPQGLLSLGSLVSVTGRSGDFSEISGGGFIFDGHIAARDDFEADFVAVAERFTGTPYLWGGRSSIGLDCSALVQLALAATGVPSPRDSDMQLALGVCLPVENPDWQGLTRGDLVFWHGHLGIMTDAKTMLHANGHHMAVAQEPLVDAVNRIGASGLEVIGVRRL